MKRTKRLVVACILIWIGGAGFGGTDVPEGSVAKLSLETPGGGARDYFVYVPTGVQAEGVDVPLLVTLAGTRVHAGLMVEMWRGIADAAWEFLRQYSLEYSPYFKEFGSP